MKSYLNSSDFLDSVKRRASIPASQNTFTDDDLLSFANEEMLIGIVPLLIAMNEEYFVIKEEIALVANTSKYSIPSRSLGMTLRDVALKDGQNNISEMTRISPENIYDGDSNESQGRYQRFYLESNKIVLFPDVTSVGGEKLIVSYNRRPNILVRSNRAGIITAINIPTNTITLSSVPSNFTSGILYDFVQISSPHDIIYMNAAAVSINTLTKTITFGAGIIPSELQVGDSVMEAGETYVPNVPSELHSMLAQRVAARCLESLGSTEELSNANTKIQEMEMKTSTMMDNRVIGAPLKVLNKAGFLRRGNRRY